MIACIASKNRPNTKTYKLFESAGIKCYHFLEPQDLEKYDVPNKININKNDAGLMYVRNFIIEYAKKNNFGWILMSDDDITEFGQAIGTKCYTKGAEIWNIIYEKVKKLPFEIVGINYRQHAWHDKKTYTINKSFVDVCVLINTDKIYWQFEPDLQLKGDREFCLKTIKYGNGIIKFNKYYYNTPPIGKNVGGLQNEYENKKDIIDVNKIILFYKPFATEIMNNLNRPDFKFDFNTYCNIYKKIIK